MTKFYELISDDTGTRLKRERREWGMSRRRLAKLSHTDPETIEYIEKGYVCMLDFNLLVNICKALQINPFDYFSKKLTDKEILQLV